jgi:hypothetical protein
LETFDFKAQPSLNKVLITELMLGEYIDKRENILLVGGHRRVALVAEQAKLTLPSHWQSLPVAEVDASASIESLN